MICHIYNQSGTVLLRKEEREPVHARDYCERCGDCLECYESGCVDGHNEHFGVIYQDDDAATEALSASPE